MTNQLTYNKSKRLRTVFLAALSAFFFNVTTVFANVSVPVMSVNVERGLRWCSFPTAITIDNSGNVTKEYCDKLGDKEVLKTVQIGTLSNSAVNLLKYYADTSALSGKQADATVKSPCMDAPYEVFRVYSFKSPNLTSGSMMTQELKSYLIAVTSCEQDLSSVNTYEAQKSVSLLKGLLESFIDMSDSNNAQNTNNENSKNAVKFPITILPIHN